MNKYTFDVRFTLEGDVTVLAESKEQARTKIINNLSLNKDIGIFQTNQKLIYKNT